MYLYHCVNKINKNNIMIYLQPIWLFDNIINEIMNYPWYIGFNHKEFVFNS